MSGAQNKKHYYKLKHLKEGDELMLPVRKHETPVMVQRRFKAALLKFNNYHLLKNTRQELAVIFYPAEGGVRVKIIGADRTTTRHRRYMTKYHHLFWNNLEKVGNFYQERVHVEDDDVPDVEQRLARMIQKAAFMYARRKEPGFRVTTRTINKAVIVTRVA